MDDIEVIESPKLDDIQPIINGVVSYGESLVKDNKPKNLAFYINKDNELIAGIVGSVQYDRFYLSHLWVHENYRNKGYGTSLLTECEKKLKGFACTSIILETLNSKAVELYLKLGYSQVGSIKEYVKGFDLVHLLKKI